MVLEGGKRRRIRSDVPVPYASMLDTISLPKMLVKRGGGAMETVALAKELGFEKGPNQGNFRMRAGAGAIFGFIKTSYNSVALTPLGRLVASPKTEMQARQQGFLNCELYAVLHRRYKGKQLPPPEQLEEELRVLGVAPKATDRARQYFQKSLREVQLIDSDYRLIEPLGDLSPAEYSRAEEQGFDRGLQLPSLLQGPLQELLDRGEKWDEGERAAWLNLWDHAVKFYLMQVKKGELKRP